MTEGPDFSRLPEYQVETIKKQCEQFSTIPSENKRDLIQSGVEVMLKLSEEELKQVIAIAKKCDTLTSLQLETVYRTLFGPLPGS
jgi:hypothetical protein